MIQTLRMISKEGKLKSRRGNPSLVQFVVENYILIFYWMSCVFAGNAWKFGSFLFPDTSSMHHYIVSQSFSGGSLMTSILILLLTPKNNTASLSMICVITFMSLLSLSGSVLESKGIDAGILSQIEGIKDVWLEYILFFTIFTVGYLFYHFNDRKDAHEISSCNTSGNRCIHSDEVFCVQKKGRIKTKNKNNRLHSNPN